MILVADRMGRMTERPLDVRPDSEADALLARARRGEDAALEVLIARHEARVYALARAILKDPEAAEDAAQETFLRVVRQLAAFNDSAAALENWVLTIARNAALDLWRKRRARGEAAFEDPVWDRVPEGEQPCASPLDALVAREDAEWIAKAVEALPGPWREVLVLRFYHNLEPAEIAKVIGVTPENARIRLWRALRELRKQLSGDEREGSEK